MPEGLRLAGSVRLLLALRLRGRRGHPARPRGQLAEHPFRLALARHDPREIRRHGLLNEVLPRLAVLDELMQERRGQSRATAALVLEDDLGEGDRGQVFPRRDVHYRDLLARTNQLLELFEGDVAALLRIVELPVGIALDDVRHIARLTPHTNRLK